MRTKALIILLAVIWIAIGAMVAIGATPDIQFQAPSGVALDLRLCPLASDTATETVNATEQTNALGWFVASCGDGRTGTFRCTILLDGTATAIGTFICTVANDENTYRPEHTPDSITAQAVAADAIDEVWDEVLTAAAHNVPSSAGRRLRNVSSIVIVDGTATAATTQTITLDADAAAVERVYEENLITILAGTGAGQTRLIVEYTAGRVATVDRVWDVTPSTDSDYIISTFSGVLLANNGVAQAGGASTITLGTTALAVADSYVGCAIYITGGTGTGQTRSIIGYTSGRVATISPAWDTQPDNTSVYKVLPVGRSIVDLNYDKDGYSLAADQSSVTVGAITGHTPQTADHTASIAALQADSDLYDTDAEYATAIWNALSASYGTAGTYGEQLEGISLDSPTAAAIWNYDISGITTSGYAGDYLNDLSGGIITVTGAVLETGELTLVRGNDYDADIDNALEWSSDDWPDLTAATIEFSLRRRDTKALVMTSIAGSVVTAGAGSQTVRVELAEADWANTTGQVTAYQYDVVATISSKRLTLATDDCTVTDKVTP